MLICCDRLVGALSHFPLDIPSEFFTIKLPAITNLFLFVESSRRLVLVVYIHVFMVPLCLSLLPLYHSHPSLERLKD